MDKVFPTIIIILMICAAIVYAYYKNWKMCGFWFSAAAVNFFVTY